MASPALLLRIPGGHKRGIDEWSFWNDRDHSDVRAALKQFGRANLPDYNLDPIDPAASKEWLIRHQQDHANIDAALGLQSADLVDVDFKNEVEVDAWLFLHFMEHDQWHRLLGI